MRRHAREWVEKYPSIKRIYGAIAGPRRLGSESTVESYVNGVGKFVRFLDLQDPEEALEKLLKGEIDAAGKVDKFIDFSLENYAHKSVRARLFGVKKWFELNGVKVDWNRIEFPTSAETRETDRAPSKEELKQLLNHASGSRDRAAILILSSSGLRVGTLLSLSVGDVDMGYPDVARLKVQRKAGRKFSSKRSRRTGRFYSTFVTAEARKALSEYLKEREAAGETVSEKSPLIGDSHHKGQFISIEAYEKVWARLLKRAGLDMKGERWYKLHLHTLRKYFRSNCVGVDPSFRERWMGHKGGYLDESYFRAEEERHLEEYRKAVAHLTVYSSGLEEKQLRVKAMLDFAKLQGYEPERLRQLEEILARARDVDEGIIQFRKFREDEKGTMTDGNGRYVVVQGEAELLRRLENGWSLAQPLNGDNYLLKL